MTERNTPARTGCWKATNRWAEEEPALLPISQGHHVACHYPEAVNVLTRTLDEARPI